MLFLRFACPYYVVLLGDKNNHYKNISKSFAFSAGTFLFSNYIIASFPFHPIHVIPLKRGIHLASCGFRPQHLAPEWGTGTRRFGNIYTILFTPNSFYFYILHSTFCILNSFCLDVQSKYDIKNGRRKFNPPSLVYSEILCYSKKNHSKIKP